jgi:hypothetical protein
MSTFNRVNTDRLLTGAVGEKVKSLAFSSSITYDCNDAGIFFHNTDATSDWIANIVNVPSQVNTAYTITIISKSGSAAARSPSVYNVNGKPVTVTFFSGSFTGDAASKTKIITISILRKADSSLLVFGNGVIV